jgi:hypothetical protein
MLFQNPQIDLASLPRVEDVEFQALASAALKVRLINWGIIQGLLLIGMVISLLVLRKELTIWHFAGIPTAWALQAWYFMWMAHNRYRAEGYALRENDIMHKKGHWWKTQLTVPYLRIQHIELEQGPIARYFGLGAVTVYTAGDSSGDLSISGIAYEEAERIKAFIAKKVGANEQ